MAGLLSNLTVTSVSMSEFPYLPPGSSHQRAGLSWTGVQPTWYTSSGYPESMSGLTQPTVRSYTQSVASSVSALSGHPASLLALNAQTKDLRKSSDIAVIQGHGVVNRRIAEYLW